MTDSEHMEHRLERREKALLVLAGASVALLTTAIVDPSQPPNYRLWWWVLIWLLVAGPAIAAAVALAGSVRWQSFGSLARQHVAFEFATCARASPLAFHLRLAYMPATGITIALGSGYAWFRKGRLDMLKELFQ